jgi:hypothetical protein
VDWSRSQQGFNARGELGTDTADLGNHWQELMRRGLFEEAWCVSDAIARIHAGTDCRSRPRHQQFVWDGTPLKNKRVLVRCYHGLGDTIQYARLLAPASAIAREIIVWAQRALVPLLETVRGTGKILPLHDGEPDVERDVDIEIAELAHALRITPASLPRQIPYIHIASKPRLRSERLAVGLVWAAGDWDPRRSVPVELLAPLAGIAGIQWEVLQRGPARARWCHEFAAAAHIPDIVEEARQLRALDLLVTVDTCSAHLAGALGVPVWTLLHADPDWRWMRERSDTLWYPTMRLFRQPRAGDWASVLVQVGEALQRLRR